MFFGVDNFDPHPAVAVAAARTPTFEPFHAIGQCAALSQTTIRPAHAFAGSRLNPLWLLAVPASFLRA